MGGLDIPRLMTEGIVWGNTVFQNNSELRSQAKYADVHFIFFF